MAGDREPGNRSVAAVSRCGHTPAMWLRQSIAALAFSRLAAAQTPAPAADTLNVIPRPVSAVLAKGSFTLGAATTVWADRAFLTVARQLARDLEPATGFSFQARVGRSTDANRISFQRDPTLATTQGAEGYRLEIRPTRVVI